MVVVALAMEGWMVTARLVLVGSSVYSLDRSSSDEYATQRDVMARKKVGGRWTGGMVLNMYVCTHPSGISHTR